MTNTDLFELNAFYKVYMYIPRNPMTICKPPNAINTISTKLKILVTVQRYIPRVTIRAPLKIKKTLKNCYKKYRQEFPYFNIYLID